MGIVPSSRCPRCGHNRHVTVFVPGNPLCIDCRSQEEASTLEPALLRAFQETHYTVRLPGQSIVARVGVSSNELATLLSALQAKTAAFITAANPFSRPMSDTENASRNDSMAARALNAGAIVIPAVGSAADGSWHEPSFLLVGVSRTDANELADAYEQNAYLWVEGRRPVEIVLRR